MKKPDRVAVEILGPAFVGTVLLFVFKSDEFAKIAGFPLYVFIFFPGYLLGAYLVAILPSVIYCLLMEAWLSEAPSGLLGKSGTVVVSSCLGWGSGYLIHRATEAPVTVIGVLVGFVLGLVLVAGEEKTA